MNDPLIDKAVKEEQEVREVTCAEDSDVLLQEIVESVIEEVERVHIDTEKVRHILEEIHPHAQHHQQQLQYQLEQEEDESNVPLFVTREKERPPHTVTGLVLMVAILIRIAFFSDARGSIEREIRVGLCAAALVFLFYCTLQLQDGEVTRPHPVLWRFLHGVLILYLLLVVFLLSQSSPFAIDRVMQVVLDPRSGTAPLPRFETSDYTADCSLTNPENLWSKVWDRYFFAHFFGWMVKALILRDWGVMWTCSLLFEVMEVTLQRALPNFKECWWDRWLLDIFGCNFAGMYVGMKIAAWIGAREYDWTGMAAMTRRRRLLERVLRFATPKVFPRRFEWHAFSSWKRFGISVLVVLIILSADVNGFLLKSALQVPTESYLNVARVILVTPAGYASVVELFAFAEDRTNRIGRMAWLSVSLAILEILLALKNFSLRDSFTPDQRSLDDQVRNAWIATFACASLVALLKLTRVASHAAVRALGRLTMIPFTLLLFWDAWKYGGVREIFISAK